MNLQKIKRARRANLANVAVAVFGLLVVGSVSAAEAATGKEPRPNIVWIMLEDWTTDLGCYGNTELSTPHVDGFATQGIRFDNAFCTAPVCSSSRSAMTTGFHQNYIGGHQHDTKGDDQRPLPYRIKTMPQLLKESGYFTTLMISKKTHLNFSGDAGFMRSDWKERKAGQPFFAQITLGGTHRKWNRDVEKPIDADAVTLPPYYADTPFARRDWANGLEQVQICDREIGDILARLDAEGLPQNTVVFLIIR